MQHTSNDIEKKGIVNYIIATTWEKKRNNSKESNGSWMLHDWFYIYRMYIFLFIEIAGIVNIIVIPSVSIHPGTLTALL